MDAVTKQFYRSSLLLSLALLIPASALATGPTLNLNGSGTNTATVTLFGTASTQVSVASSATPTTEITYAASTTYDSSVKWLCLNPSPAGVPATCDNISGLVTPDSFFIQIGQQAGSSALTPGTHTATVTLTATDGSGASATITVQYTPGSNSGNGGNTGNGLINGPSSISQQSLTYGATLPGTFQITTSSASPIGISVAGDQTWIAITGVSASSVSSGAPVTISYQLNGFGQSQAILSGNFNIGYGAGNNLRIPVTFGNGVQNGNSGGNGSGSLSVGQNPVNLGTYTKGSFSPPSTTLSVTGNSAITYAANVSSANYWLLINGQSNTTVAVPTSLNISASASILESLSLGINTGTFTISGSDGSLLTVSVTVNIVGPNTSGISVSPNPITLNAALNGSAVQTTVTITSTTGGFVSASTSGGGLSVSSPASQQIPANGSTTVVVTGNPFGLSAQTYVDQLNVTVGGNTQSFQVNFVVGGGSSGGTGSLSVAPTAMSFSYQANSAMQSNQAQQVYLAGSGNYSVTTNTNVGSGWLSVSSTSGALPSQFFQISTNAFGLASGTYTGTVTFNNTSTGQTAVVSVTLTVTGTTVVYTSPGDVIFNYIAGTSSPSQSNILVPASSDGSSVPVSAAVTNSASTPWLSLTSNGGSVTGQASYSVTVNASNLANGLYSGSITISAGTVNSPITVPVVLNVVGSSTGGGGTGNLTLGASSLTFQVGVNGSSATQQLSVSAATATNFTASSSTSSGNTTWLSVSPAGSNVTNTTLGVTVNPAGLAAGTYSGQITLSSNSGTQTVSVSMIVGGTAAGGNILVTANGGTTATTGLTFSTPTVGGTVNGQYLSVTSATGSSGVQFTASLSGSSCGWVTLGIIQGTTYTTPVSTITVGANTASLASGNYSCNLVFQPNGGTAVTVPLALSVNGTPTISVTTTSLTFSYAAGTAAPSAQTFTVNGSGSSAATFAVTATSTPAGWLSATPTSGTASAGSPATVTVNVNASGLSAGTYTGTIAVTAGSGSTGSGTVTVTLTVTAPTPSITTMVNGASFLGGSVSPGEFVSLFGTSLGPVAPVSAALDNTGKISTSIGNVQVFFDSTPAPLVYVSSGQINCVIPYEVSGLQTVSVKVVYLGVSSNTLTLNVVNSAPGVFSSTGTGTGQGAFINTPSLLPNTASTPAKAGSIIEVFVTGEGITNPAGVTGAITGNATTFPVLKVAVSIGGQPATILFAGELPGNVAGVMQVNVMIPSTVSPGNQPLVVTVGSVSSQTNLTVAVN